MAFSLSTRPLRERFFAAFQLTDQSRDEHEAVLTARRGDVEAARDKMVAHMNQDVQRGLANFDRIRGV